MFIIYATKGYLFFLYKPVSQSCKRQPADESTENFTKYCINQIEIAYVVIFGTTLLVGIASAFYIARFKAEMIALIISIPNFRADFISYLNNDGLLSQVGFGNDARLTLPANQLLALISQSLQGYYQIIRYRKSWKE